MGIKLFGNCSSSPYAIENSNPDPEKFLIKEEIYFNNFLILIVNYINCTNFEGEKIMVYRNIKSSKEILDMTFNKLDPHFSNSIYSPIARFKPDKDGIFFLKKFIGWNDKKNI